MVRRKSLNPRVEFVNVIPDYVSIFQGSVDRIEGYVKEEKTVGVSVDFPFGVKTMHRNFASDIVVETCPKYGITVEDIASHYYKQPLVYVFVSETGPRTPTLFADNCNSY